ncbi:lantibiotic dehydratase [Mesoterricola sediminis]|uniref:Lantibiotic dehydratase n=1 Tax=Mesoterricola sediminis TaxID=2927980 RepID=A0AA48GQK6_9BACT|nr:lantibiotic dehydratase [Mesoterricola sediminis]BDU77441.1 lantibiotic dehydratase [Mesoterricola sediminis]
MEDKKPAFHLDDFFAFRIPLLPYRDWETWSEGLRAAPAQAGPDGFRQAYAFDMELLRSRLRLWAARPEVREALFVASPDLVDSLPRWAETPDSEGGRRTERALVRYLARMCNRPTPFGLFAAHGTGHLGPETRLSIAPRVSWNRHSRLDMGYVDQFVAVLEQDRGLRGALSFRPNSSLYTAGGQIRWVRSWIEAGGRRFELMGARMDDPLRALLEAARDGIGLTGLTDLLWDGELAQEEIHGYLHAVIDRQILVSDLQPPATGKEPLKGLAAQLDRTPSSQAMATSLSHVARLLEDLDSRGLGQPPEAYRALRSALPHADSGPFGSRPWQVDLFHPPDSFALGHSLQAEIMAAVTCLRRFGFRRPFDPLGPFKAAFTRRYEDHWPPLLEALDPESGIGLDGTGGDVALGVPLLEGLEGKSLEAAEESGESAFTALEAHLLKRIQALESSIPPCLDLQEADMKALNREPAVPLPDSFSLMVELAGRSVEALDSGDGWILVHAGGGPSAARMLGRFCHGDPDLASKVRSHLKREEGLRPGALFAEIAHLGEGRMGNVLARPVLRDYEIPCLGRSGAEPDRWLPLEDLHVGLRGERLVLWSRKHDREVLPRLASAAAYQDRGNEIYRFLGLLQDQGVQNFLGFSWGRLETEPCLPRLTCGRMVFARAQWRLETADLDPIRRAYDAQGRFLAFQELRQGRRLPRRLVLADSDQELPVDLDNPLSVEALWSLLRVRKGAVLLEDFPSADLLPARGPDGAYRHQLILTFLGEHGQVPLPEPPPRLGRNPVLHAPGSEWLYARLYMGRHTADRLLAGALGGWIRDVMRSGMADRWFFLRYSDPEPHLRLRFHGDPGILWGHLLPSLKLAAQPWLAEGSAWGFQLDAYVPETGRYGGTDNLERAERVFQLDSDAVLEWLGSGAGSPGADRWRLAMVSVDGYYEAAGFTLQERLAQARARREDFRVEFGLHRPERRQRLGAAFRRERPALSRILAGPELEPGGPALAILEARNSRLRVELEAMRALEASGGLEGSFEAVLASLLHMSINRLLASAQRPQEAVIHDFLVRWYESWLGRDRKAP